MVLSTCSLSACFLSPLSSSFAKGEGDVNEGVGLLAGGDCIDDFDDVFRDDFEEDLDDFFDRLGV